MPWFSTLSTLFGWASDLSGLRKDYRSLVKGTKGHKRMVLIELQQNMDLMLDHYQKKGGQLKKIIPILKTEALKEAMEQGFDFSKIKRGKIKQVHLPKSSYYKKYLGSDLENLFERSLNTIEGLRVMLKLDPQLENPKYRPSVRIRNLIKLQLLIIRFIKA